MRLTFLAGYADAGGKGCSYISLATILGDNVLTPRGRVRFFGQQEALPKLK